ncbi:TIGR03013 family XrtA/PEP-CTERM system glycosyltransferase [Pelomicrobium sp.]|uniref:TIGR03013 family XrtA/PEP-CTERM system glycosyltransferase n=1 Tax=Pelomicrobium sp. TaxID=2815319 RepID=UPI002FDD8737
MLRFFSYRVALASCFALAIEAGFFFIAMVAAVALAAHGGEATGARMLSAGFFFAGLMVAINGSLGLYRQTRTGNRIRVLGGRVVLMLVVGWPVAYAAFYLFPQSELYQSALGYAMLFGLGAVVLLRWAMPEDHRARFFTHRILVLGAGPDALNVERALASLAPAAMEVVGFYPLNDGTQTVVPQKKIIADAPLLPELVRQLNVHEVIVAARERRGGVLPLRQLLDCRLRGVRVNDLPAFFERLNGEVPIESLKASWLIYGDGFRQGVARTVMKRAFDLSAAGLLLVVAAPVMVLAAIAIFLESGRPVVFKQERVGAGGRTFNLLKFRSMRQDAEADGKPRWAAEKDDRVTRVGRFIRRTRIDELPQLINVLKGDMSFVGPRPERPYFMAELTEKIPFYGVRHSVKPGITGWAQVRYCYGSSVQDARKKLQFDLYYVKNHSLLLDLVILFETVRVVLLGEGAR